MANGKTPAQRAAQSKYIKSRATLSIVLSPELKADVADCATKTGMSQAEFIRNALEIAVEKTKRGE